MTSQFDKSIIPFQSGWGNIQRPTLLVNKTRAVRNLKGMITKAVRSGTLLRPHFKTHQLAQVGEWFRAAGVDRITVSSLSMAAYFAENGWRDITVAFPVNIRELPEINSLARRIRLNLLVESLPAVRQLSKQLQHPVGVWMKIDTGYGRTGLAADNVEAILALAKEINESMHLEFMGLLSHSGHTYNAENRKQVIAIHNAGLKSLQSLQQMLQGEVGARPAISMGDTPSCSVLESFNGVDEMRPGNFIYYDLMQWGRGVCEAEDIAAAVACPVVAVHPERDEVVVYGGAVHLSKEMLQDEKGHPSYGRVAMLEEKGWGNWLPQVKLGKVSQEHGILQGKIPLISEDLIGKLVAIIPNHSCLAADLLHEVCFFEGDQ